MGQRCIICFAVSAFARIESISSINAAVVRNRMAVFVPMRFASIASCPRRINAPAFSGEKIGVVWFKALRPLDSRQNNAAD